MTPAKKRVPPSRPPSNSRRSMNLWKKKEVSFDVAPEQEEEQWPEEGEAIEEDAGWEE